MICSAGLLYLIDHGGIGVSLRVFYYDCLCCENPDGTESFAVINWIDLFIRNVYKDVVVDSLRFCQKEKGLELYGWCIMTSHVHLIIGTTGNPLENIMRDLKRHTSEKLRK